MLRLKKVKPVGCQVLVTKNLYGWDDFNEEGIIVHQRGDLKTYQTVVSVGSDVKFVKPGDVVKINLFKYCEFQDDPNSVKVNGTNKVVKLHLNIVEMVDEEGDYTECFLIDQRDVEYILEDFEEVSYKDDNLIKIKPPKKRLILPDNRIKL